MNLGQIKAWFWGRCPRGHTRWFLHFSGQFDPALEAYECCVRRRQFWRNFKKRKKKLKKLSLFSGAIALISHMSLEDVEEEMWLKTSSEKVYNIKIPLIRICQSTTSFLFNMGQYLAFLCPDPNDDGPPKPGPEPLNLSTSTTQLKI